MMTRGVSSHLTWADLLAAATTPGEVIRVVRDFMATWTPQELAALPADCQPPNKFGLPEDIVLYTFMLVDHEMKESERWGSAPISWVTRRVASEKNADMRKTPASRSRSFISWSTSMKV